MSYQKISSHEMKTEGEKAKKMLEAAEGCNLDRGEMGEWRE